ncbi:MAG: M15 family metallopeptidase [Eubacteriales bacterium]|nr:M15 family metallopeptidase [Eubacteriales bacterium]
MKVYLARMTVLTVMVVFLFGIIITTFYISLNIKTYAGKDSEGVLLSAVATGDLPLLSIDESEAPVTEKEYVYTFVSDISEYEEYMNPAGRDDFLLLVNYENLLIESYMPTDLTEIPTRSDREVQKMRNTAAMAFKAMLTEAEENGITDITVTSGWRSYNTQVWLLSNQVNKYMKTMSEEEAYNLAITEVAVPGTSEHQSGLAVDIHNLPYADISFAETESAKWLDSNCYKFGFILRYPENKTEITRISFEPWHFRFVGRYHASRMYELGFCLEEYLEYMS